MRRHLGIPLAIAMILAAHGARAEDPPEEVRIGFATPLTGPFAATGAHHRAAAELAVKDLNERRGARARAIAEVGG